MTFKEACELAASYRDGCTRHVNATLMLIVRGEEKRVLGAKVKPNGYTVSDWCDQSTVRSYTNGKERS